LLSWQEARSKMEKDHAHAAQVWRDAMVQKQAIIAQEHAQAAEAWSSERAQLQKEITQLRGEKAHQSRAAEEARKECTDLKADNEKLSLELNSLSDKVKIVFLRYSNIVNDLTNKLLSLPAKAFKYVATEDPAFVD